MIMCTSCGTANEAGRKFCGECAAPLSRPCPTCGMANPAGAKFCGECAAPLAAGASTTTPTAGSPATVAVRPIGTSTTQATAVAERRLVSVLFADLVGFTPFAAERDAEDVRETLTRCFDLASEVIDPVDRVTILNAHIALVAATGGAWEPLMAEIEALTSGRTDATSLSMLADLQGNVQAVTGRPAAARPILLQSHALSPYPASVA